MKNQQKGKVTVGDMPSLIMKVKSENDSFNEEEIRQRLGESHSDMNDEIDFEGFLKVKFSTLFGLRVWFSGQVEFESLNLILNDCSVMMTSKRNCC